MEPIILASDGGVEERILNCEYDFEIGGDNDFELTIPAGDWRGDVTFRKRIYMTGTEYGGIVRCIESNTSQDVVYVRGYTWRGYLHQRYYKGTVNKELNEAIAYLLGSLAGVFVASTANTGMTVSYTTEGYETVGEILTNMAKSVGYRLALTYRQTQSGGYVFIEAVKSQTYGEVSQDSPLDFTTTDDRMGVNHLIVTDGSQTVHMYTDEEGNIVQEQQLIGIDELQGYYETTGNLTENGEQELEKYANTKSINVNFTLPDDIDYAVGDFITGRDFITGITATKPIVSKILTCKDGETTVEYSVEEKR